MIAPTVYQVCTKLRFRLRYTNRTNKVSQYWHPTTPLGYAFGHRQYCSRAYTSQGEHIRLQEPFVPFRYGIRPNAGEFQQRVKIRNKLCNLITLIVNKIGGSSTMLKFSTSITPILLVRFNKAKPYIY